MLKLCLLMAAILDGGRGHRTQPLKMLGQINRNLVGSIYGMSSMTIAHFVPIG
jgi:hypothetical protein